MYGVNSLWTGQLQYCSTHHQNLERGDAPTRFATAVKVSQGQVLVEVVRHHPPNGLDQNSHQVVIGCVRSVWLIAPSLRCQISKSLV